MATVRWPILILFPVVMAAAILGVWGRGRRGLSGLRLRWLWLIWLAAAVQFARSWNPPWGSQVLTPMGGAWPVLAIWLLALVFVVRNFGTVPPAAKPALAVFVLGFSLNTLTIVLNGGMPFSPRAAERVGLPVLTVVGHLPITGHTRLSLLSDVIALPPIHRVVSIGDLLISVGIIWLLVAIGLGAARSESTSSPTPTVSPDASPHA